MSRRKQIMHGTLIGITAALLIMIVGNLFKDDVTQIDRTHTKVMKEARQKMEESNNKHIIVKP